MAYKDTCNEIASVFKDERGRFFHWIPELGYSNFFTTFDEMVIDMARNLIKIYHV